MKAPHTQPFRVFIIFIYSFLLIFFVVVVLRCSLLILIVSRVNEKGLGAASPPNSEFSQANDVYGMLTNENGMRVKSTYKSVCAMRRARVNSSSSPRNHLAIKGTRQHFYLLVRIRKCAIFGQFPRVISAYKYFSSHSFFIKAIKIVKAIRR